MHDSVCCCDDEVTVASQVAATVAGVIDRLHGHFRRREARTHAADYVRGLLADVERKNGWQLAEQAGYAHPRGIQRVLNRYSWDADAVRDDLRETVVTTLGAPDGILVVDETGFPKKGHHSAGVARQYSGTLGKIGNCQVGVFLTYAGPHGFAAIDRELYLPREWLDDPTRCRRAGIPEGIPMRTKPRLAREMVERALDAGVPAAWVVADEVYGSDYRFRQALEARDQPYVVAVRSNQSLAVWPPYGAPDQTTPAALMPPLPDTAWDRLSCGDGAQGPRLYDWALVPLRPAEQVGWHHALLVRRHPDRPAELAWYLVFAPAATPLAAVVQAAGTRWTIEEAFKLAKGQVGLDHYEVRSWQGWYRHITLTLLALAALAAAKKGALPASSTSPDPSPSSGACWSGSLGRSAGAPIRSAPGPAGGAPTSKRHGTAIAAVA
jgi:SRSO17 transposase